MGGCGQVPAAAVEGAASASIDGLKELFVVPQRIHMTLGTLADQVTYPEFIPPAGR
jgi:ABC-type uncharacterized transport system fused permease/ATPase subunit